MTVLRTSYADSIRAHAEALVARSGLPYAEHRSALAGDALAGARALLGMDDGRRIESALASDDPRLEGAVDVYQSARRALLARIDAVDFEIAHAAASSALAHAAPALTPISASDHALARAIGASELEQPSPAL